MTRLTVFLHGFTGHADSWDEVIARLPEGERALAITLSAHDFDPAPAPTTYDQEVDRIAAIVNAEHADRVRVCGYSLGGRIALGLLARHPALFASAILIGANPGLSTDGERAARATQDEEWAKLAEREGTEAFIAAWSAQPLFASQLRLAPETQRAQREKRLRHSARAIATAMRNFSLAKMPNFWPELPRISTPTRFLAGELDTRFVDIGRRLASTMPNAILCIAKDVGHNVVLEAPDEMSIALRSLD
ncbi:MAG: alpha/beta fold hydrolase [Polyangiaceae bacterium]